MTTSTERVRVAVVGGGCAALTTAFELSRPEHNGRYEVTVYQMGWRLGGKGASGRGVADRIEEHGLHLWMGFYENAFRLMRDCYGERHAATATANGTPRSRTVISRTGATRSSRRPTSPLRTERDKSGSTGWRTFLPVKACRVIRRPVGRSP